MSWVMNYLILVEISALIYNFTCEVTMPGWQQSFFYSVRNEDVRALKDTLENLNSQMSTSRRILSGILLNNSGNYKHKSKCFIA